jgi:hypothetical protein
MPIQTVTQRNALATAYAAGATHAALATTAPGAAAGTEPTGGSPAYARKPANWSAAAASVVTATPAAFDVASGTSVVGAQFFDALTAGNYRDGGTVPTQAFASQGTYTLTATYTQT